MPISLKNKNDSLRLKILHTILNECEFDIDDLCYDYAMQEYNDKLRNLLCLLINDIFDYFSLINLHFHYILKEKNHYACFRFDFEDINYDFINMTLEEKNKYSLLNIYMLLKRGICISKKVIDSVYGEELTDSKLISIKKQIENNTNYKIIKNKDLSYCFEREVL